jgi:hypothetical protein
MNPIVNRKVTVNECQVDRLFNVLIAQLLRVAIVLWEQFPPKVLSVGR